MATKGRQGEEATCPCLFCLGAFYRRQEEEAAAALGAHFERLFVPLDKELHRVAFRLMGAREDALDVVQEAYFKAWRAFPRFRGECSARTWIYRILTNLVIDRAERPDDDSLNELQDSGYEPEDRQPGPYEQTAMRVDVERVLRLLEPRVRNAVVLRGEGLSYAEVGEILGVTRQTVSYWMRDAKVLFGIMLKVSIDDASAIIDSPASAEVAPPEEPDHG